VVDRVLKDSRFVRTKDGRIELATTDADAAA
jgi:hypothetical protein